MHEVITNGRSYKTERKDDVIIINGNEYRFDITSLGKDRYHLLLNNQSYNIEVVEDNDKQPVIKVNGSTYASEIKDATDLLLEKLGINIKAKKDIKELRAPMPGLVLDIRVEPGVQVNEGDPLIVLEAMKMENILKSPTAGTVKSIAVKKGEPIDKNTLLISFE